MSVDSDDDSPDAQQIAEDSSKTDTSSIAESELDTMATSRMGEGGSALYKSISSLVESSKLTGIGTTEEEVAVILEKVAKWILRSLKCIDSPKEVYEKNAFRPFDEFVETGVELLAIRDSLGSDMELDDTDLIPSLNLSWGGLLSDQLVRLKALQWHRDEFITWSKRAPRLLSSKENRVTLKELNELAEQSHDYPCRKFRTINRNAKVVHVVIAP